MNTLPIFKPFKLWIVFLLIACFSLFTGCNKEDDKSYTVTVGVYLLNGGTYDDQNKDLVFQTQEECQTWSRTSQADSHSTSVHNHFNGATNTTYDSDSETITWTEYGPELDQSSIDATCANGNNGAIKSANKTEYSADKNFFLKIKSVVEN